MKNSMMLFLILLPCFLLGQVADTALVRLEVDSLIQQYDKFIQEEKVEDALAIIQEAREKCQQSHGRENMLYAKTTYYTGKAFLLQKQLEEAEEFLFETKHILEAIDKKKTVAYAYCLTSLGKLMKQYGEFLKADTFYLQAHDLWKEVTTEEHLGYLENLLGVASHYNRKGEVLEAEQTYWKRLNILEKKLGKTSFEYREELKSLIDFYFVLHNYDSLKSVTDSLVVITQRAVGKKHIEYAKSLKNLVGLYRLLKNYEKAIEINDIALSIVKEISGEENLDYLVFLGQSARIHKKLKKPEKTVEIYLKIKKIQEKLIGKSHPKYIQNLKNLAIEYIFRLGQHKKGFTIFEKIVDITEKEKGKESIEYAKLLGELGRYYALMGNYEKGIAFKEAALKIIEKNKKVNGYYTTKSVFLSNLIASYMEMGNYSKAEKYAIQEKNLAINKWGIESTGYSWTLEQLGFIYQRMDKYDQALPLLIEVKERAKEYTIEINIKYALALIRLGGLYIEMEKYKEAEVLHLEAKSIFSQEGFTRSWTIGDLPIVNLHKLGYCYIKTKQFKKAESILIEAKQLIEEDDEKENSIFARNLNLRALLLIEKGDYKTAQQLLDQEVSIYETLSSKMSKERRRMSYKTSIFHNQQSQLLSTFGYFSESEKTKFIQTQVAPNISLIQSSALYIPTADFRDLQYETALLLKGVQLQASKNTLEYVLQQKDSVALESYYDLLGVRRRLSKQYELPPDERKEATALEQEQEVLEKKLARLSATFRKEQAIAKVGKKEVQAALKPSEAAIEFIHFNYKNPTPTDSVMYAAVVLKANDIHAHFIPLFEENQLQQVINVKEERRLDYVDQLYTFSDRGLSPKNKEKTSLYDLIWKPLDSLLLDVSTIYCSPSGLLNRLNLGAIPIDETYTVSDKYALHTLFSTRILAVEDDDEGLSNKEAMIFGDVNYDVDSSYFAELKTSVDTSTYHAKSLFGYSDRALRSGTWRPLKWTKKEVNNVQELLSKHDFKCTTKSGYDASERLFKQIGVHAPSPQVLHLATHGFFFPDPKQAAQNLLDEPIFKLSENPMIRSGLILAGANHVWQGNEQIEGTEDGILTAYEISQMNLTNTELVVLSACETGLGDIQGNEGVFGLQRAFKMAGAKYLIMSLWQVPDFQTQDLMTTFYEKWLEEGLEIPAAFREAQMEMKEKYENPYFWAGFVLVE